MRQHGSVWSAPFSCRRFRLRQAVYAVHEVQKAIPRRGTHIVNGVAPKVFVGVVPSVDVRAKMYASVRKAVLFAQTDLPRQHYHCIPLRRWPFAPHPLEALQSQALRACRSSSAPLRQSSLEQALSTICVKIQSECKVSSLSPSSCV